MWPFTDEPQLDDVTSDFNGVGQSITENADSEEAGLQALQDAYKSYEFEDPEKALGVFQTHSDAVRKKFGDTKPLDFQTTLDTAPKNFDQFTSDLPDPSENKIDVINQWESENLKALSENEDLNYKQIQPQLERGIKQAATMQRRQIYGSDNYLVTDQALRFAQGAVGPIAELVGADSVTDYFNEHTDPDGSNVFGYVVGGDDSYWSAVSSGLGSVAGAVGAGVATGGWGTAAYLGASGAGAVRGKVEDALNNEATPGEALAAGAIETASQIGQVAVGEKVFGGAVEKILGKSSEALGERVFPNIVKSGLLQGGTGAAGTVASNVAQNVGRGEDADSNLLQGVPESFVAGAVGGGLAEGGAHLLSSETSRLDSVKKNEATVDEKVSNGEASLDILPDDGSITKKGVGSLNYTSLDDSTLFVTTLGVYPEAQNKGSGTALITELADKAKAQGKDKIVLEAIADSEKEQPKLEKFYQRQGFEFTGRGKEMVLDLNKHVTQPSMESLDARAKQDILNPGEDNPINNDQTLNEETKSALDSFGITPGKRTEKETQEFNRTNDIRAIANKEKVFEFLNSKKEEAIANSKTPQEAAFWEDKYNKDIAYEEHNFQQLSEKLFNADPILDTDGLPPPKSESIPGKLVSTELQDAPVSKAVMSDGSEIVQSDGKYHLVKDDKVLQPFEQVKLVTPEVADNLRKLHANGNPDGTAFTLTTDGTNLLAESEFLNDDLTPSGQKTGKQRVVIPTTDTAEGSVPVFVSKTRTSDDVRQNPSFIAPGKIESTAGAAKAGFGNQYVSPFMKRMMEKYGPALSEELGLSVESFQDNVDGTVTSVQNPLQTKFKTSNIEQGSDAVSMLNEKGIIGTLDHFNSSDRFNDTDVAAANIAVSKLEQLHSKLNKDFSENPSSGNLDKLVQAGDLLSTSLSMKDKVLTVHGRGLQAAGNTADAIHNSKAKGEFRVAQIENELKQKAYQDYQKKTGEAVNLQGWAEEASQAEKEVNKLTPKEGEVSKDPEKLTEAKSRYDTAVKKIKDVDKLNQEKLADLTPEKKKNLIEMYDLLGKLNGEAKLTYAGKVFEEESRLGLKDITEDRFQQLFGFYRGNLLSGMSTQLRNFVGNTSKALSDIVGLVGTGEFQLAGHYLNQYLKATPTSFKEAQEIVKGNRAGRFKLDQKVTDAKGEIKDLGKAAPLTNPFTAIQNVAYRLLTAQDAISYRNANSAMAYLAEHVASKNLPPSERKAYIEKALGYDQEGNIRQQVEKESQMLRDAGIDVSKNQMDLDVAYRMEKLRSEKTREIADKFGEGSTFVKDPGGLMGALYDGIETVADKISVPIGGTVVKPVKFLLPFTRVATNIASHIMEFTPVGIVKGLANSPDAPASLFNHQLGQIDAKMVLGRGLVGTSFMAGFFAFAHAFKDDEDPYIAFYGYPGKGQYKEWQAKGIEPYSMKIGDNIIPLQGTSLAIIPAIIGGGMEALKSGADVADVIKSASMASLGAVSTMSFIKPAGDLFEYLMGSKDAVNTETGKPASGTTAKKDSNFLKNQVDSIASGFIPASGFLNNLGRWTNASPVESYNNLAAKVFGEMPFTQSAGITDKEPQLNIFGEPITKSLVQRMSAGLAPHTIKTDPVLLWMQETGFDIPDQGPIMSLTRKAEKENFGEVQKNITGYSNIMDESQSRRVLQLSGPRIKDFLNSIRQDPNFQVKGEKAQKFIDDKISEIRAEAKLAVLQN